MASAWGEDLSDDRHGRLINKYYKNKKKTKRGKNNNKIKNRPRP